MAEEKRTFDNDVRVLLSVSQLKSNRFRSTYQLSGLQRPCISRLHCRESNLSFYICMYSHIYVHKYIPTGWLLCRNGRPTQFVFLRSVNDSPFVTPFVYRPLRCETRQKRRRSAKRRVCVCIYIYTTCSYQSRKPEDSRCRLFWLSRIIVQIWFVCRSFSTKFDNFQDTWFYYY